MANTAHAAESGFIRNGFVLQAPQHRSDKDHNTFDGVFVRIKHGHNIPYKGGGYSPETGDELILRGSISEEGDVPVVDSPELIRIVRKAVNLDAETPAFVVNPPEDLDSATKYWHAHYGTRCVVPAGSIVQGYHASRWKSISSSIALIRRDHLVAQRKDPYTQRLFRDEHPLDDRPPQVAVFRPVDAAIHTTSPVYLLNNHFASRPDKYVEQRKAQAAFNAAIVKYIYTFDERANVIVAGDLNTFPRPCEPVPSEPDDQLGTLYDAGLSSMYDVQIDKHPTSAYSYVYQGQAQTIDHIFISPSLLKQLVQVIPIHINSDYAPFPAFENRGCSDHDPQLALFDFSE
ncbi:MAG: hypothetical protein O3C57_03940 [Verrucomicrobia bacterium]|nr:hypothetical protein [Verrucomicrobiota bacterium]